VRGSHYRFSDEDVEVGVTYYYKLEDVDFRGHGTFHGPVWATPGGDRDGDGMPDPWEEQMGLDPNIDDSKLDHDGDGLTNLEEFFHGLDPWNADTDGDGIPDGLEIGGGNGEPEPGGGGAQGKTEGDGVRIIESDDSGVTVELVTSGFTSKAEVVDGVEYQKISIPGYSHGYSSEVGLPEFLLKGVLLEVPTSPWRCWRQRRRPIRDTPSIPSPNTNLKEGKEGAGIWPSSSPWMKRPTRVTASTRVLPRNWGIRDTFGTSGLCSSSFTRFSSTLLPAL
jgi:hypothetical protein